ncbi:unnamed protein product [Cyprideis torosa]|uniref:Uncharacterized protein n=1 Tax=Cyprideis torosa TaxID=163714 RepID=A0A7R8WEY6_9CRUS|nr:unnamed protein product [Cyprideis torosa]CAG0896317.1 unnamed protein product [Cyprideis torosa]
MTWSATKALLALIRALFPACRIPKTLYMLKKQFRQRKKVRFVKHYTCMKCNRKLSETLQCLNEGCVSTGAIFDRSVLEKAESYFISLPVRRQLQQLLQRHNEKMNFTRETDAGGVSDVTDGKLYKESKKAVYDVTLTMNYDSAPLFQSSGKGMIPILCIVNELPVPLRFRKVLLFGIRCGRGKPDPATFLQPFYEEAQRVIMGAFDAPQKAEMQNQKQYNGKHGCGSCELKGEDQMPRVYLGTDFIPRTAEQTEAYGIQAAARNEAVMGVKGPSVLTQFPGFDRTKGCTFDVLHTVELGVMRHLCELWLDSSNHERDYYIPPDSKRELDRRILALKVPGSIHRLPRSLNERKHFKGSEYRTLLLITFPLTLRGLLPKKFYEHFMLLSVSAHSLYYQRLGYAELAELNVRLRRFVLEFEALYGMRNCSYNVHQLLHVTACVYEWGPVTGYSMYTFECYNGILLNFFHGSRHPAVQISEPYTLVKELERRLEDNPLPAESAAALEDFTLINPSKRAALVTSQPARPVELPPNMMALGMAIHPSFPHAQLRSVEWVKIEGVKFRRAGKPAGRTEDGIFMKDNALHKIQTILVSGEANIAFAHCRRYQTIQSSYVLKNSVSWCTMSDSEESLSPLDFSDSGEEYVPSNDGSGNESEASSSEDESDADEGDDNEESDSAASSGDEWNANEGPFIFIMFHVCLYVESDEIGVVTTADVMNPECLSNPDLAGEVRFGKETYYGSILASFDKKKEAEAEADRRLAEWAELSASVLEESERLKKKANKDDGGSKKANKDDGGSKKANKDDGGSKKANKDDGGPKKTKGSSGPSSEQDPSGPKKTKGGGSSKKAKWDEASNAQDSGPTKSKGGGGQKTAKDSSSPNEAIMVENINLRRKIYQLEEETRQLHQRIWTLEKDLPERVASQVEAAVQAGVRAALAASSSSITIPNPSRGLGIHTVSIDDAFALTNTVDTPVGIRAMPSCAPSTSHVASASPKKSKRPAVAKIDWKHPLPLPSKSLLEARGLSVEDFLRKMGDAVIEPDAHKAVRTIISLLITEDQTNDKAIREYCFECIGIQTESALSKFRETIRKKLKNVRYCQKKKRGERGDKKEGEEGGSESSFQESDLESLTEEEAASFRDVSLISTFPQPCDSFAPSVNYAGPCLSTAAFVILGSPSLWVFLPPFLVIVVTIVALFCRCRTSHCARPAATQPSPMPLRLLSPSRRLPHPSLLRRPLSCPADLRLSPVPRPVLPPPRSVSLSSVSAGPLESFRPSRPLTTEGTMSSSTLASARDQPPTSSLLSPMNPFW